MHIYYLLTLLTATFAASVRGRSSRNRKLILTNDDGWAVAMIRAQNDALRKTGYDVVLSCPAENKSGTGSSTAPPTVLNITCEFNTCPIGAPAEGFNASDIRLNYVNSFPADSIRFGIQTLAPKFFGKRKPDFVVAGPNVGNNLGPVVLISGTVGAACEAALEGVPSVAFSSDGASISQVSYTTLESDPESPASIATGIYAALTVKFTNTLLAFPGPILPPGISINVNYPATTNCTSPADFKFIFTRINPDPTVTDVRTCGSDHLPAEASVVATPGCFASVSVFNASTKADVDAKTQRFTFLKLRSILTCLPSTGTQWN